MGESKSNLSYSDRFTNNFDFLRLLGAFLVIFSHSYILSSGSYEGEFLFSLSGGNFTLGNLGVMIFFVISGYLITASWLRKPDFSIFFKNRILRIVPGLFGVALFTIFLIGPLVTILPLYEYFTNPLTYWYFHIVSIYYVWGDLPGVFVNNIYPNVVNGSLWILGLLFTMYIIIFLLGILGILKKRLITLFLTILFAATYLLNFNGYQNEVNYFSFVHPFFSLINYDAIVWLLSLDLTFGPILFMIGSLFYLYREKINYNIVIFIILIVLWILSLDTPYFSLLSFIAIPYLILFLAFADIPLINKTGKYGDFSYGIYIYAFPIQQTIAYFLPGISMGVMFILTLLIVIPVSFISFRFLESKALKLKI